MAGLLSLLDLGSGAIVAQNSGVAVSGRNTANINTEGYSRENIDLESLRGTPLVGGVRTNGAYRTEDLLLGGRERLAAGATGRAGTLSSALDGLQRMLAQNGGPTGSLGELFGALDQVAASPLDEQLRAQALQKAQALASQFNSAARAISAAQSDSDGRISNLAERASQLAGVIANANKALATSPDPVLADKRDLAAKQLADLVGGQARMDPDGKMRFVAGAGVVLVDGDRAATLRTTPDAALGNHLRIEAVDGPHVSDLTSTLDGGQLAGEIAFRDGSAAKAASDLDQLAFDLANEMNNVHTANAGLDGVTGRKLFGTPAAVSGAALGLSVAIRDPRQLAAAAPGAGTGDSSGMLALIQLRDQTLAGGGTRTFLDEGVRIVTTVGASARAASDDLQLESDRAQVLAAARDSISGVSSEEELAKLQQFKNASEAATQFVAIVNDLLKNLIEQL